MAVPRTELSPPLPPETRTIGQLVAESLRLYGARFWASVALGFGPAAVALMLVELPDVLVWTLIPTVGTAIWTLAYIGACRVGLASERDNFAVALAVGFVAFLPLLLQRIVVVPGFDLVTLAFFAFVGLGVPAALVEGLGFRDALRRGTELARADYVHALGSLATLVLAPLFLLGAALLYVDQAARVVVDSGPQTRRNRDADVHPALEPDGAGRSDAEVEP